MTFQPCPGVAQVTLFFSSHGQTLQNVYHVYKGTPIAWEDWEIGVTESTFQNWWAASGIWDYISNEAALDRIQTMDLTTQSALVHDLVVAAPFRLGRYDGPACSNNATLAIKLATQLRRRGGNGRVYIVGLPKDAVSGDQVLDAFASQYAAQLQVLSVSIGEDLTGASLCVLSRYFEGMKRTEGIALPIIGIYPVDLNVDSQRDRLAGHRRE